MRLNIIDPSTMDLIGVLTQYESIQWVTCFNTSEGSFQINCSTDYIDLLQVERYIENTEELDHVGVIKKVETIATNQKTSLQVNGVMLEKDIFYRRVIKAWIVYQDMYPTRILASIIGLSLTEPPEPSRVVPNIGEIIIPKDSDVPDMVKVEYSSNFANLGDEVFNLIQNLNLGVKSRINHETGKIDIEFYTGNDYTYGSDDPIVFSPERGTVLETDYAKDSSQNATHIVVIGEDNVILQAERERAENEPIIEKSIDLSSDCPWPTYRVEKPNEDGGTYYRYKKYTPPADFITNRDVWEKYAVDRIETQEKRYREVEQTTSVTVTMDDILKDPEILSEVDLDSANGFFVGSPLPSSVALGEAMKNTTPGGEAVDVGYSKRVGGSSSVSPNTLSMEASVVTEPVSTLQVKARSVVAKSSSDNVLKKVTSTENKLGVTSSSGMSSAFVSDAELPRLDKISVMEDSLGEYTFLKTEKVLEEYEVTIVTYETKDFLEYVYVNPGDEPSEATMIVQGSFASGDAIYYENFEDVRVEEAKYREALMIKAEEYLKTFVISEAVEVTPYYLSNLVYNTNYSLGDIVTARNSQLGYSTDLRVTQATEVWDSKGYSLNITLGDSVPSLTNRIKLIAKGGI